MDCEFNIAKFVEAIDRLAIIEANQNINTVKLALDCIETCEVLSDNKNICNKCIKEKGLKDNLNQNCAYNIQLINRLNVNRINQIKGLAYRFINKARVDTIIYETSNLSAKQLKMLLEIIHKRLDNDKINQIVANAGIKVLSIIVGTKDLRKTYIGFIQDLIDNNNIYIIKALAICYITDEKIIQFIKSKLKNVDRCINYNFKQMSNCDDLVLLILVSNLRGIVSQDTLNICDEFITKLYKDQYRNITSLDEKIKTEIIKFIQTYGALDGSINYANTTLKSMHKLLMDSLTDSKSSLEHIGAEALINMRHRNNTLKLSETLIFMDIEQILLIKINYLCQILGLVGESIEAVINTYFEIELPKRNNIPKIHIKLPDSTHYLDKCIYLAASIESVVRQYASICINNKTMSNRLYNSITYESVQGMNGAIFNPIDISILNYYLKNVDDSRFSDNEDLRNRYVHGTMHMEDDNEHYSNYIKLIRVMLLVMWKINLDLSKNTK